MSKTHTLTVYTYANCDTCRRAVKWLRAHNITFDEKPIRETPPSVHELREVLARLGGRDALRKVFNTSGRDYRELGVGEKLASLTEADALELLAGNGNLVKRPFVVGENVGLAGFNEADWSQAMGLA
jgi:arsenate reductase